MSVVLTDRGPAKAASQKILVKRVDYISDPSHPDHDGKRICFAKNYNTPNNIQSKRVFISEVVRLDAEYFQGRGGMCGKRSRRLFEEIIYSSALGAWLTREQRDEVERRIIARFGAMAICRTAWHVDLLTGRCDLHVLISAKNLDYPPTMTLWAEFGGTHGDHIYVAMDRLDAEIVRHLNLACKNQKTELESAMQRHHTAASVIIGEQQTLANELAGYFRSGKKLTKPDASDLAKAVAAVGHEVTRLSARSISVVFRGRKKPRRYNLSDLQDEIAVAMERTVDFPGQAPPDEPEMPWQS